MLDHLLASWIDRLNRLTIEQIGVVLTGVTLIVVLIQLRVMARQTRLMTRQTRLAERQLEIVEKQDELLARRAELEMLITMAYRTTENSVVFRFEVRNHGKKGARDFYWHLWLPIAIADHARITGRDDQNYSPRDSNVIDGIAYRHYSDRFKEPVYPSRSVPVVALDTRRSELVGSHQARWRVIADDGAFPRQSTELPFQGTGLEGLGTIPLTPPA